MYRDSQNYLLLIIMMPVFSIVSKRKENYQISFFSKSDLDVYKEINNIQFQFQIAIHR